MTVAEYLTTKNRYIFVWALPASVVVIVAIGMSVVQGPARAAGDALKSIILWFIVPVFLIALFAWCSYFFSKRFERQHPEMKHLAEWMNLIGSAESYPVNRRGAATQLSMVRAILESYARSANAAIAARHRIQCLRASYPSSSPEAMALDASCGCLEDLANRAMIAYHTRWDFIVKKMEFHAFCYPYLEARAYRESFLKAGTADPEGEMVP